MKCHVDHVVLFIHQTRTERRIDCVGFLHRVTGRPKVIGKSLTKTPGWLIVLHCHLAGLVLVLEYCDLIGRWWGHSCMQSNLCRRRCLCGTVFTVTVHSRGEDFDLPKFWKVLPQFDWHSFTPKPRPLLWCHPESRFYEVSSFKHLKSLSTNDSGKHGTFYQTLLALRMGSDQMASLHWLLKEKVSYTLVTRSCCWHFINDLNMALSDWRTVPEHWDWYC